MKDPCVRSCGFAAKGLWVDMLCLMWESPERGYLMTQTGRPMQLQQLSNAVGGSKSEVAKLLKELRDSGVFSETENDCIFCRRMVRDEEITKVRRACGSMGGNPVLVNQNGSKPVAEVKIPAKQTPTPSSSSSVSSSSSTPQRVVAFQGDLARFIREYPKEVNQVAQQLFMSVVNTAADESLLFANLKLYCQTDQWKRGIIPAPKNWLSEGSWKVAPKVAALVGEVTKLWDPMEGLRD